MLVPLGLHLGAFTRQNQDGLRLFGEAADPRLMSDT
jgi:hypothetical protein